MKFPKLKQGLSCVLLVCSPLILWLLIIIVWACFSETLPYEWVSISAIIVFLGGGIAVLIYILKNFVFLMMVDAAIEVVGAWKKARMYYENECNGKDRKTAEDKILRRMKLCGREREVCVSEITPIAVHRSCRFCQTVFYRAIEKISIIYSVSEFDEKNYQKIMISAKRNIQKTHYEPKHTIFEDKEQRKAPVAVATAVIILADRISDEIPELVMKKQSSPVGEMLVCVGDMSIGRYYFDSVREPYIPGTTEKPEKNYALDIVKRLVFGGKLPLKDNDNYVLTTDEHKKAQELSETVLWDFIRDFRKETIDAEREQKKIIASLKADGIRLIDDEIYCRYEDKITSSPMDVDENDPKNVTVYCFNEWIYPKKRTMSKKDIDEVEKRMKEYLISEGYKAEFKNIDEYLED